MGCRPGLPSVNSLHSFKMQIEICFLALACPLCKGRTKTNEVEVLLSKGSWSEPQAQAAAQGIKFLVARQSPRPGSSLC